MKAWITDYSAAKSKDELLLCLSNRVMIVSSSIMLSLKLPKRIRLILDIFKKIRPRSHKKHWSLVFSVYCESLVTVIDILSQNDDLVPFIDDALHLAKGLLGKKLMLAKDEEAMLEDIFGRTIIAFHHNPPTNDAERTKRILDAYGKEPKPKELSALLYAVMPMQIIAIVKPWEFKDSLGKLQ